MKIKLTPELSYIIGFWRKRRTFEGIGIKGEKDKLEIFSKEILDKKLTTTDKLLSIDDRVWFFHSAYRKFFQDIEMEQLVRFKYLNEYAASYLAGMFDSIGGIDEKGMVFIERTRKQDEMLLIRLGFGSRWRNERLVVEKPKAFLMFIKNYVKLFANHKVFEYLKDNQKKIKMKTIKTEERVTMEKKENAKIAQEKTIEFEEKQTDAEGKKIKIEKKDIRKKKQAIQVEEKV